MRTEPVLYTIIDDTLLIKRGEDIFPIALDVDAEALVDNIDILTDGRKAMIALDAESTRLLGYDEITNWKLLQ